ncbi:hypothetical protein ACIQF5_36330, partial [Streptomyces goshikiensis]|uniref:hypothetical protein n=1 Tax=Streptomyces goshikiensis TaxID=1942 RepID=UPI0038241546
MLPTLPALLRAAGQRVSVCRGEGPIAAVVHTFLADPQAEQPVQQRCDGQYDAGQSDGIHAPRVGRHTGTGTPDIGGAGPWWRAPWGARTGRG